MCQLHVTTHHLKTFWSKRSTHQITQVEINNVYNFDAHPWPKNTILIAGDSMINGINKKCISTNFKSVKVRCFRGVTIDDMYFNLISLLRKKLVVLVLHLGTNNSSNETLFEIYDKMLSLVQLTDAMLIQMQSMNTKTQVSNISIINNVE